MRRRELTGAVYLGQVSRPRLPASSCVCWVGEMVSFLSGIHCSFHSRMLTVFIITSVASGWKPQMACFETQWVCVCGSLTWMATKGVGWGGVGTYLKRMRSTRNALDITCMRGYLKKPVMCFTKWNLIWVVRVLTLYFTLLSYAESGWIHYAGSPSLPKVCMFCLRNSPLVSLVTGGTMTTIRNAFIIIILFYYYLF